METPLISKKQFNKIRRLFPARKQCNRLDDRKVISAIILVIRYGHPWRYVPDFYGKWTSIYSRFIRGSRDGIIQKIFYALAHKLPKRCKAMHDSSFCKAQRSAASMRSDGKTRELGRSRGGITTKINLLCNSEGMPMDFCLTGGNVSDIKTAPKLTDRNKMKCLIADKAYGSKAYRKRLDEQHTKACIPPKSNEKIQLPIMGSYINFDTLLKICFQN